MRKSLFLAVLILLFCSCNNANAKTNIMINYSNYPSGYGRYVNNYIPVRHHPRPPLHMYYRTYPPILDYSYDYIPLSRRNSGGGVSFYRNNYINFGFSI